MPEWNQIVEEFKAEYGDKIEFLKVNGTDDNQTSNRYHVHSFPSFIALEPGTKGDKWKDWKPTNRSYAQMKSWIKALLNKNHIGVEKHEAATPSAALANAADKLHNIVMLSFSLFANSLFYFFLLIKDFFHSLFQFKIMF